MTTDYDPIAEQYKRSKLQPWRTAIESFTLLELIGDPLGLAVLDLACGEGFYTRLIRERGATRVVGVDLSPGMIELARQQERHQRLGVEYRVGDARDLKALGEFDLVMAAYLLNYARTREELQAMCDGIACVLKPGGRFVTVNCNPALAFPAAPQFRDYGFETCVKGPWQEGAPITWTFYLSDGSFEIENYHLSVATHEIAFRRAGFKEVRWHSPRLSPEAITSRDLDFWSSFIEHPPVTFIECVKQPAAVRSPSKQEPVGTAELVSAV